MKPITRLILTVVILAVVGSIYYSFIRTTDELGSFGKFSTNSEINQNINVAIVKSKGIERDGGGRITSFYGSDRDDVEVKITLHDPAPPEIADAEVVELIGHLHVDAFVASHVTVVR
jgi:hypothetical protein